MLWKRGVCSITLAVERCNQTEAGFNMPHSVHGHRTRRRMERREVRHKDENANIPSSDHPSIPFQPSCRFIFCPVVNLLGLISSCSPSCRSPEKGQRQQGDMSPYIQFQDRWFTLRAPSIASYISHDTKGPLKQVKIFRATEKERH